MSTIDLICHYRVLYWATEQEITGQKHGIVGHAQ